MFKVYKNLFDAEPVNAPVKTETHEVKSEPESVARSNTDFPEIKAEKPKEKTRKKKKTKKEEV